jgi:hypothetical protein
VATLSGVEASRARGRKIGAKGEKVAERVPCFPTRHDYTKFKEAEVDAK